MWTIGQKILASLLPIAPTNKIRKHILKIKGYKIGDRVSIGSGIIVVDNNKPEFFGVKIGNDVTIGPRAVFISVTAHHSITKRWCKEGKIILEDGVFIGAMAIIMPGVTIGENSTVGAGAVVTKDVSPNTTVVGVPAKPIQNFELTKTTIFKT